ncbi:MAG: beta-hydroxyacyl-ACP dehydratase [Verrucomicrobia bacterium]|nr:beta-hydroxyacyl-ACP dehydratase [Verrucomicrobiota bacterium]
MDIPVDQHLFAQALAYLPHGREFRFLDAITQLTPGISGAAHYLVRGDEPFLAAHFPGHPMMPGVILVEAIAQLGGVVCQSAPDQAKLTDVRLTAIRNAKILGAAAPGDILLIRATIEGRMAGLVQVSGEVQTQSPDGGDRRLLASAKITLSGEITPPIE